MLCIREERRFKLCEAYTSLKQPTSFHSHVQSGIGGTLHSNTEKFKDWITALNKTQHDAAQYQFSFSQGKLNLQQDYKLCERFVIILN
jgi:hypothetical protein